MKTSTRIIAAICAIFFTTQISFAQLQPVYDLKTQKKITKIEEKEKSEIEKAKLDIDKARNNAINRAEQSRSKADAEKIKADTLRAKLEEATQSLQDKAHEDILAITSVPYQSADQVQEMKEREKKISKINKDAIKGIEKLKKDLEKAEKNAEKAEKNALRDQQRINEDVRKAEENTDKKVLKIRSKSREQIAKLQPVLY